MYQNVASDSDSKPEIKEQRVTVKLVEISNIGRSPYRYAGIISFLQNIDPYRPRYRDVEFPKLSCFSILIHNISLISQEDMENITTLHAKA